MPVLVNKTVDFDIEHFDQAVFSTFSESLKNTIMASPEYQERGRHPDAGPPASEDPSDGADDIPF